MTKPSPTILSLYLCGVPLLVGIATCAVWGALFSLARLSTPVLFFQGCIASIGSFALLGSTGLWWALRGNRPALAAATVGLSGFSIGVIMSCFVVFPVSYDRSVSIFLLARIASASTGGMGASELTEELSQRYIEKNRAIERRIEEQLLLGTINQSADGQLTISERGRALLCLNPFLERIFGYHNPEITGTCSETE
jgi:hypothetical protein